MTHLSRQPEDVPIGAECAPRIHAQADTKLGTIRRDPADVFSPEDLVRTEAGAAKAWKEAEIAKLRKTPLLKYFAIRKAEEWLQDLVASDYKTQVTDPAEANEKWHRKHPEAPDWAHPLTVAVDELYKQLRGFELVAESGRESPGLSTAKAALNFSQLDAADLANLTRYFNNHERHASKDHHPDGPYWQAQRELNEIALKIPPMRDPVPVWRGEKYSTRESEPGDKQRVRERIHYLMNLRPGAPFVFPGCIATSLSLHTAAAQFSGSVRPENFLLVEPEDSDRDVMHQVIFELETDRGIHLDDTLPGASHVNENEILIPMRMQFEVVGHAQLDSHYAGFAGGSAYHVIKLRLSQQTFRSKRNSTWSV